MFISSTKSNFDHHTGLDQSPYLYIFTILTISWAVIHCLHVMIGYNSRSNRQELFYASGWQLVFTPRDWDNRHNHSACTWSNVYGLEWSASWLPKHWISFFTVLHLESIQMTSLVYELWVVKIWQTVTKRRPTKQTKQQTMGMIGEVG